MPQQLITSLQPWDRVHNPANGTSWYIIRDDAADLPVLWRTDITRADTTDRTSWPVVHLTRTERPILTPREERIRSLQRAHRAILEDTFKTKLRQISYRTDDWDDKGSRKPNPVALSKAHLILENFLHVIIESGRLWRTPFISSDEDGHVTIEWQNAPHELHIEISEDAEEYLKIWGINIEHEMHLDFLQSFDYIELWDWLY